MLFDIYEGRDLTATADRIMFRQDAGDITTSEYVSSIEMYKTVVSSHVDLDETQFPNLKPPVYSAVLWRDDAPVTGDGVYIPPAFPDRRKYTAGIKFTMGEVASSLKMPADATVIDNDTHARLQTDGFKYLKENKDLEVLTAEISPQTQYKYKRDYDLGDIVLVQGKYGTLQKMLVSEYTRTSDANGVSGYPTLVRWENPNDKI
jgi:hypothetical protein